jgi:hypothetical protein
MQPLRSLVGVAAIASGWAILASGPTAPTALTGAWKVLEVTRGDPDLPATVDTVVGLFVFTETHYSIVWDGDAPRPGKHYSRDFNADAGTYLATATTFTTTPSVAYEWWNHGRLWSQDWQFRVQNDTLLLRTGNPTAPSALWERYKLVRVE